MPKNIKTEIEILHKFDPRACRHTLNGENVVLHCHHYASLYTQLACDCGMLDAKALLAECAEDTFYEVLSKYYAANGIDDMVDRIAIAEQYYSVFGLGQLSFTSVGPEAGTAELPFSHIDAGWIKKWGKSDRPVNFVTQGYISAAFAAIYDKAVRTFSTLETASIVSGAPRSEFKVVMK